MEYSIIINGKKIEVSSNAISSLYENCKDILATAKTIPELEKARNTIQNRIYHVKRLRVIECGDYSVAEEFKKSYIGFFEALIRNLDNRLATEKMAQKSQEEKRQKGENAVREMLANAEIMYRIGQKQSLIAILRSVKSLCADFGIEIPNQYTSLLEKSTSI